MRAIYNLRSFVYLKFVAQYLLGFFALRFDIRWKLLAHLVFYDFDYFEKSSDYVSMYASISTIWRKKPSMKFETFIPLKESFFI